VIELKRDGKPARGMLLARRRVAAGAALAPRYLSL